MRSILMGAAPALVDQGPPLLHGDRQLGYYGRVPATDLITGTALGTMLDSPPGLIIADNQNTPWLKFSFLGKTIYVAQKPHRSSMSFNDLVNVNLVNGNRTVVIKGKTYKVRILNQAYDVAPLDRSEVRQLMRKVFSPGGTWDNLDLDDLMIRINATGSLSFTAAPESGTICRGMGANTPVGVTRIDRAVRNRTYGWRPVLELVE